MPNKYAGRYKHKQWWKDVRRKNAENQKNKMRSLRDSLKVDGCVLCGYSKCMSAIEFHHVADDKEINAGWAQSANRLLREASKCIVVCANCHREIHAGMIEGLSNVKPNQDNIEELPLLRLIKNSG